MSEFNKCQRSKEKILEVIDNLSKERLAAIGLNNGPKVTELASSITYLHQTVKFIDNRMKNLKQKEKPNKLLKQLTNRAS